MPTNRLFAWLGDSCQAVRAPSSGSLDESATLPHLVPLSQQIRDSDSVLCFAHTQPSRVSAWMARQGSYQLVFVCRSVEWSASALLVLT